MAKLQFSPGAEGTLTSYLFAAEGGKHGSVFTFLCYWSGISFLGNKWLNIA